MPWRDLRTIVLPRDFFFFTTTTHDKAVRIYIRVRHKMMCFLLACDFLNDITAGDTNQCWSLLGISGQAANCTHQMNRTYVIYFFKFNRPSSKDFRLIPNYFGLAMPGSTS